MDAASKRIAVRECSEIYEHMFEGDSERSGAKWVDLPQALREFAVRCFEAGRNR